MKVQVGLVSSETSPLASRLNLLQVCSRGLSSMHVHPLCFSSSYNHTSHIELGPHSYLTYLLKSLYQNVVTLGLRTSTYEL